jgi:hypothetical protein
MAEAIGILPPCVRVGWSPSDASETDNIQNVDLLLGFLTLQTALIYKSLNGLSELRQDAFSSLISFALAIAQYLPCTVGLDPAMHKALLCEYGVLVVPWRPEARRQPCLAKEARPPLLLEKQAQQDENALMSLVSSPSESVVAALTTKKNRKQLTPY